MASEPVDPIDWSHPHPHGQYPLNSSCSTYCTLLTQPTNRKSCCTNRGLNTNPWVTSMPDQCTTYVATQAKQLLEIAGSATMNEFHLPERIRGDWWTMEVVVHCGRNTHFRQIHFSIPNFNFNINVYIKFK